MTDKAVSLDTLPWVEKYRPSNLNNIISQNQVISVLKKFIEERCLPHLLFYGPPGTGKTSTIMACAKELYGEYYPYMVMELNASDDRGIEVVRNRIIKFANKKNVFFGKDPMERNDIFKLVILDETDAMTADAQAILRKVVENYTSSTRFCLICNYIQNINPALQSRCTRFRFSPLEKEKIREKILDIVKKENIEITNCGINTIINKSRGDMRKVINTLQSTSKAYKVVNEIAVNKCSGYPQKRQIEELFNSLVKDNFNKSYRNLLKKTKKYGLSLTDILNEIHNIIVEYIITGEKYNFALELLNEKQIIIILDKLREIEFNQSVNTLENIQLSALVGIFHIIKS